MLKIEDNVDLKELEKYGYSKSSMYGELSYNKDLENGDTLAIIIDTRTLFLDAWEYNEKYLLEVADDLIKADLVEKIGEYYMKEIKIIDKLNNME